MKKRLSIILLILCFGNALASAQTEKAKNTPTGLALEVTFIKGRPPAYLTVGDSLATAHWAWYAAFGRVPNFQNSAERPLIQAVKFIPFVEDGAIKVRVKVMSGEKSFDREETIALYTMREGERVSVKELTNYGVVPFEISIVRVTPTVSVLPAIENRTKSLQVTAVEPNFSNLPTYKLSVLNNSSKAVSAFTYETVENNRRRTSGIPEGEHDENFIEPGATFTRVMPIPLEYKQPADGEVPKPASGQTIVISSVIFTDGSYEGDAAQAARYRSYIVGRKVQIKQIIQLLESFENDSAAFDWNKFAAQSARLESKVGEPEFAVLLKQFPALGDGEKAGLRGAAETAADIIKQEFIQGTTRNRADIEAPATTHIYLTKLKEVYQRWLARLA